MKKLLLFALALVAGVLGANAKTQVDGIWYILNSENGTATVTFGEEDGSYAGRLIIPGSFYTQDEDYNYYEFTVTAIGDSAFRNCPNLSGITIPNTVETVGLNIALGSDNISELKIEEGETPIALTEGSFTGAIPFSCTYLFLGRNVLEDGGVPPFHGWSSVQNVVIGERVTEVPLAFCPYARDLKSIQLNMSSVLEPGVRMFSFLDEDNPKPDAKAITLYVPNDLVKRYEQHEFWSRFTIQGMDIEQQYGIKFATSYFDFRKGELFYQLQEDQFGKKHLAVVMPQVWYLNPDGSYVSMWSTEFPYKQSSIVIPDSVTFWKNDDGSYTRYSGTSVSGWDKLTWPVEIVGDYCFRGASNLQSVTIPSTVYRIGGEAFEYADKLHYLTIPNSVTEVGWLAFARSGLKEIVIPASSSNWLESDAAFQDNANLVKATFAKGTTAIQDRIFFGCTALRTIIIPDEVEYIGPGAFAGCEALIEIHLPASLKVLNNRLFRGCPLRTLEIPAAVEEIEGSALLGTNIGRVTVDSANPFFDSRDNCNAIIRTKDNTLVAATDGAFIPESVDSIAPEAFNELYGIRSITLPENLKRVSYNGFMNLENLTLIISHIEKPAGVLEESAVESWYDDPFGEATLYIPAGTLAAYRADEQWNKFQHIVEMTPENKPADVEDIKPLAEEGNADIGQLAAGTDLSNAIVNNLYVTCDQAHGDGFNDDEKGIVFQTVVDDIMLQNLLENPDNMDIIRNNFSGLILELPAGNGTLTIRAKTVGDHLLSVLISGEAAQLFSQLAAGEINIPFDLLEKARVYLFGSIEEPASAPTKHMPRHLAAKAAGDDEELKPAGEIIIYDVIWTVQNAQTAIDQTIFESSNSQIFKLMKDGQILIQRDGQTYTVLGTQTK